MKTVLFKPDIEDLVEWPVILVNVGKLLSCWEARQLHEVGPVGHWPSSKRAGIEEFLDEKGGAINVPRAGIHMQHFPALGGRSAASLLRPSSRSSMEGTAPGI
ncbi:hypothetical protein ACTMU2_13990 [Cupriavidus basilensis]